MYIVNFKRQSNIGNLYDRFLLVADDDDTPIDSDEVVIECQMWARTSRGYGDQSQWVGMWPGVYQGYSAQNGPIFTAATDDGTGRLALVGGVLTLDIPHEVMEKLRPGYYEMYMSIMTPDRVFKQQLAAGVVPMIGGGVWPGTGM